MSRLPVPSLLAVLALLATGPAVAGSWRATRTLDGPAAASSPPDAPQLAMNRAGAALVAWNVSGVVRYAELKAGGGWTATRNVPGSGQGANFFGVGLGASGAALVGWTTVATRYVPSKLVANWRAPGGTFGSAVEIAPGQVAPGVIRAAVDCDGNASLVWMDGVAVWAVRLAGTGRSSAAACDGQPGAGPWSAPRTLSSPGEAVSLLDLAANDDGALLATWQAGAPGAPTAIVVARGAADGTWASPQVVSAATGRATWNPRPGLDAAGNAAVGWLDGSAMVVARQPAGGAWGAPETVSGVQVATWPALAMAPDGTLLAAWQRADAAGTGSVWQASAAGGGGAWSSPRRLSSTAEDAAPPSAATASAAGPAVVAWVDDATNTARAAVAATGASGPWKTTSLGGGWWGGLVPVGAGAGGGLAAWPAPLAGNPNAVVVLGRPWR